MYNIEDMIFIFLLGVLVGMAFIAIYTIHRLKNTTNKLKYG